ncbi:MAG: 16S rRNA (guanine(527)-N(7))-methyltransferase RsmG [Nitrosomonadales bacterium]|nr:16S rRNA (guanine(527)-N(7))-methyltransferase RsmG [Nitrosomonadales bacterium]
MLNAEEILRQGIGQLGLNDSNNIISKLLIYKDILLKWNKAFNLTALRDEKTVVINHLLDSLSVAHLIQENDILDVGSGAGLPGIVLALYDPKKQITLVDKVGKKAAFMRQVCIELDIKNVDVIHCRVEDMDHNKKFDAIVARAFSEMDLLINLTKNIIKKNGYWYGMKSKKLMDEIIVKRKEFLEIHQIKVPFLEADRYLIKLKNV